MDATANAGLAGACAASAPANPLTTATMPTAPRTRAFTIPATLFRVRLGLRRRRSGKCSAARLAAFSMSAEHHVPASAQALRERDFHLLRPRERHRVEVRVELGDETLAVLPHDPRRLDAR